ncbi:MAG: SDR family oxidoreductase [Proteobacteria bacterium]|nr:SDR family oxidoreductase [Pseudomonadota bacterium]
MAYFITGGTGFIGRHLVALLAARGKPVYVLLRPGSRDKLAAIALAAPEQRRLIIPVEGDLDAEQLGIAADIRASLQGRIEHFFHLAALYDLNAGEAELQRANVAGTRHAIAFAQSIGAGCLHLASSIAVAGQFQGCFTEQMFAEASGLDHPYFRTKHEAEALVRDTCRIPWRIYRPGMVVGHSRTGEMDKVDGPYYFFKPLQKLRGLLPEWLPLPAWQGGYVNLVPVDFVAAAFDHLAHLPGRDGRCFHLTDPVDRRIGEVLDLFARAAHAPRLRVRLEPLLAAAAPTGQHGVAELWPAALRVMQRWLAQFGIPPSVLDLLQHPTRFDAREAQSLLAAAGIRVPALEDYAWRLWDYWERQLDPKLRRSHGLRQVVGGKTVLVTGGSSGIGRATAIKLARAGARVLVVARDPDKLASLVTEVERQGGHVQAYSCDISNPQECERFLAGLLAEHGRVDILINNAGRSIRRAVEHTFDRLHDYERLMRLNFHAAVQVTLRLLPAMLEQRAGHVVNISSIGVLGNAPRFAGYNASKAALEAFSRSAGAEFLERGVRFTVVNMPLVRTPMVKPTRLYDHLELLEAEQAADIVCRALIDRPERVTTGLGLCAQLTELAAPGLNRALMSESFSLFGEVEGADNANGTAAPPGNGAPPGSGAPLAGEIRAFASFLHGIHW